MLSLETSQPVRGWRNRGHHIRTTEDQACLEALAAFLRSDTMSAGRSLHRVSKDALALRLLPAARALAQAANLVLAEQPVRESSVKFDYALSPACLLGMCSGSAPGYPCRIAECMSPTCQHSCHDGEAPRLQTYSAGIAGSLALARSSA